MPSKPPLTERINRWLIVMALSLEGLGWPTAAELWLAELSRPPETQDAPLSHATPAPDIGPEGDLT